MGVGPKFHQTLYGRKYYEQQLPALIEAINRNAKAVEENNKILADEREWRKRREYRYNG